MRREILFLVVLAAWFAVSAPTLFSASDAKSTFELTIDDVCVLSGRGTVVTGRISKGKIKVKDKLSIFRDSASLVKARVTGVEKKGQILKVAEADDDEVGLTLEGLGAVKPRRGDVIRKP